MGLGSSLKKFKSGGFSSPLQKSDISTSFIEERGSPRDNRQRTQGTRTEQKASPQDQQVQSNEGLTSDNALATLMGQDTSTQGSTELSASEEKGHTGTTRRMQDIGGSDDLDILSHGLDFKRDIAAMLGVEAKEDIGRALQDVNKLIQRGIAHIGLSSEDANMAIRSGALSASDIVAAGITDAQGYISEGQQQALNQISDKYGLAQAELGKGREDIARGFSEAASGLSPYAATGESALADLARGATPEGFGARLETLATGGALDPLINERMRALQSAQGAAGLSRSGAALEELAQVPTDVLLGIEGDLTGRQQLLSGQGLGAQQQISGFEAAGGQALGGLQGDIASLLAQQGGMEGGLTSEAFQNLSRLAEAKGMSIGDLMATTGTNLADVAIGRGENIASLLGSQAEAQLTGATSAAEARREGMAETTGFLGNLFGGMMSDKRLKKNIEKVGEVNGVNFYTFEANELGKEKGMVMNIGVIADEIQEIYPDLVGERDGYKTVNYPELLKRVA